MRINPLTVPCPYCGMNAGQRCYRIKGFLPEDYDTYTHVDRRRAAIREMQAKRAELIATLAEIDVALGQMWLVLR